MNEIKGLKDRLNKINELLDKLDEKLVNGEITEAKYQELCDKYRVECDSLKNQIVEKELLQEVGLSEEDDGDVEYPKPDNAEKGHVRPGGHPSNENFKKIFSAFFWMMLFSVFIFWIPFLGSFIVGFVGGKKAGSSGKAVLAGIIPIIFMFGVSVEIFGDYSSSLYTDNGVIIASTLLIPILVVIGAIKGSRRNKKLV